MKFSPEVLSTDLKNFMAYSFYEYCEKK
jgi:hypothetical protein